MSAIRARSPWRAQRRRLERGQAPVLALGVEDVGRCADRGAADRDVGVGPGERARRVDPDREVAVEADPHAGGLGPALRLGELALGQPLQPAEEGHAVGVRLREGSDVRTRRVAPAFRPLPPGPALLLRQRRLVQRLEGGVPLQGLAHLAPEVEEGAAARRGVRGQVPLAEGGEGGLEQPAAAGGHGRVVDELRVVPVRLGVGGVDGGAQPRVLGHLRHEVGGDVDPVEEAPVRGGVGAAVLRCREEEGVQRVEADEVSPLAARRPGEGGEIREVAAAEVANPFQAVDLHADPEAALDAEVLRDEAALGGRDQERGEGIAARPLQLEPVVAGGQGCREQDAVLGSRRLLPGAAGQGLAALERHPPGVAAHALGQRQDGVLAGAQHQHGRECSGAAACQRLLQRRVAAGVHPHGGEQRALRRLGGVALVAVRVGVAELDPVGGRDAVEEATHAATARARGGDPSGRELISARTSARATDPSP